MNSQKFNNVISLSNLVGKTQQFTSKSCELNLEKYLTSLYYNYIQEILEMKHFQSVNQDTLHHIS